ncbi:hypothetical protein [Paenibacillus sp. J22TS3]|uniref:hypothetical protein n=1 Tax=Paenibacillus sp. J22TS3 TaxID=2807192 RepID=UPI001AFFF331|nr:hypothetical protein [Paenibacillus sp. J22TS3]GIP22056.1 hypothetical protein J22TS3_23310 [Paenibacillus sp. J22TS3]
MTQPNVKMDPVKAAGLLEKWISFYDMNDPKAWDKEEYGFVKDTCKAMQLSAQVLRGKGASVKPAQRQAAAAQLLDWVDEYEMDNPGSWEKENVSFVKEVVQAITFAASYLNGK